MYGILTIYPIIFLQILPSLEYLPKVSGEVPGFYSKLQYDTILADIKPVFQQLENALVTKTYFGGNVEIHHAFKSVNCILN